MPTLFFFLFQYKKKITHTQRGMSQMLMQGFYLQISLRSDVLSVDSGIKTVCLIKCLNACEEGFSLLDQELGGWWLLVTQNSFCTWGCRASPAGYRCRVAKDPRNHSGASSNGERAGLGGHMQRKVVSGHWLSFLTI